MIESNLEARLATVWGLMAMDIRIPGSLLPAPTQHPFLIIIIIIIMIVIIIIIIIILTCPCRSARTAEARCLLH